MNFTSDFNRIAAKEGYGDFAAAEESDIGVIEFNKESSEILETIELVKTNIMTFLKNHDLIPQMEDSCNQLVYYLFYLVQPLQS